MMIRHLALMFLLAGGPAFAGVEEAVEDHVLPRMANFAVQAGDLADAAADDCTADALRPPFQDLFDAWLGVSHLRFGPLEEGGRALSIGFWPDTRGMVGDTVARLIAEEDPVLEDPDAFAEVSIAGRGLFALERLLFEPELADYDDGDYECRLVQAIAEDLAMTSDALLSEWRTDQAPALLSAGDPGNTLYLSAREPAQVLYTALTTGLGFTAEQRLGRPLGTFERPRPERAEARRSGRPLRNVALSLEALRELARALADGPIPETEQAFAAALEQAATLDPVFAGVSDPSGRLKVEILQQRIERIQVAVTEEIGVPLGISQGFNAADGD